LLASFQKNQGIFEKSSRLVRPILNRLLILYLTIFSRSMGDMLGQHDDLGKQEQTIYYFSKRFNDYKSRYPLIEKTCCGLVWTARRLHQYMLYYTTWLVFRMDPLKYIFESPYVSGRVSKWQVILSEYDVKYMTQKSIKGSAIAEYLAHHPVEEY